MVRPLRKGDTTGTQVSNLKVVQNGEELDYDLLPLATTSTKGAMSDTQFDKLAGIEDGADVTDSQNVKSAGGILDSDFGDVAGAMRRVSTGFYTIVKDNLEALVAPTANDDTGDGYSEGSLWVDTVANKVYFCADATLAGAVWKEAGGAGGALSDGDKGDITVSASGATWTIDADVVDNTKLANITEDSVKVGGTSNAPTDLAIGTNDLVGRIGSGHLQGITLADISEDTTPAAGDFLLGWSAGGALAVFDVGDLPTGTGISDGATLSIGLTFPNTGLHLLDTNASHDLIVAPGSDLTADRTLTITTGDVDRTLTLNASTTLSGTNSGDVSLSGTPDYITITGQTITRSQIDLAADVTGDLPFANFVAATAESKLVGRGAGGGAGDFQEISLGANLSLSGTTLNATGGGIADGGTLSTGLTFPNTGLHILDTNATHDLILAPGSDLTADRTLTVTTGDASRTVTINADTTLSGTNTGDQFTASAAQSVLANATGSPATPTALELGANDLLGRIATGDIQGITLADLTEDTAPAAGDFLLGWSSGGAIAKFDVGDLPTGGGGEINTASNVGTAGVGLFKQKSTYDLQFKKLNAGSSLVTITDDTGNDEVDVDLGTMAAQSVFANATGSAAKPAALEVAEQRIVGRKTSGNVAALTAAEVLTLTGAEATANKNAASGYAGLDARAMVAVANMRPREWDRHRFSIQSTMALPGYRQFGFETPLSIAGKLSTIVDSNGVWTRHTTANSYANEGAGVEGPHMRYVQAQWYGDWTARIRIPSDLTNCQVWVGLQSRGILAATAPAGLSVAAFRYINGTDTKWTTYTCDGTDTTEVKTSNFAASVAADTIYELRVSIRSGKVEFWLDGTKCTTDHTANLPVSDAWLAPLVMLTTAVQAARSIEISRAVLEHL